MLRICDYADDLLEIVRWAQQGLPWDERQEIERRILEVQTKP